MRSTSEARLSVSRFPPVPHCQYHDLFPALAIQSDKSPTPEFNHPLAELQRQLLDVDGAFCISTLGNWKGVQTRPVQ